MGIPRILLGIAGFEPGFLLVAGGRVWLQGGVFCEG